MACDNSLIKMSKLLINWISPKLTNDENIRPYIADNLLFYTVLFGEYIGLIAERLPLNSVLIRLNQTSDSQIITEASLNDLKQLHNILTKVFIAEDTVEWIFLCIFIIYVLTTDNYR